MAFWSKKKSSGHQGGPPGHQGGTPRSQTAPPGDPSLPGTAGYRDTAGYCHRPSSATNPAGMTFVRPDGKPDPKAGRH